MMIRIITVEWDSTDYSIIESCSFPYTIPPGTTANNTAQFSEILKRGGEASWNDGSIGPMKGFISQHRQLKMQEPVTSRNRFHHWRALEIVEEMEESDPAPPLISGRQNLTCTWNSCDGTYLQGTFGQ